MTTRSRQSIDEIVDYLSRNVYPWVDSRSHRLEFHVGSAHDGIPGDTLTALRRRAHEIGETFQGRFDEFVGHYVLVRWETKVDCLTLYKTVTLVVVRDTIPD